MREACRRLNLPQEPLRAEKRGEPREQHLERDFAAMLAVGGEVYGGHAPPPQHAAELIARVERGLQVGGDVRRHGARI